MSGEMYTEVNGIFVPATELADTLKTSVKETELRDAESIQMPTVQFLFTAIISLTLKLRSE